MRVSWKRLVQVAVVVFLIWVSFNIFLSPWKNRKTSYKTSEIKFNKFHRHGPNQIHKYEDSSSLPLHRGAKKGVDPVWTKWTSDNIAAKTSACGGKFTGYQGQFAIISNITINPKHASGRRGGENIKDVLNQPEHQEFFKFLPGFFEIACDSPIDYRFSLGHKNHINFYKQSLSYIKKDDRAIPSLVRNKTVFVVTRYEYVNIYHSMTDFYNAFLQMSFFDLQPDDIVVLLADAHPKGGLDSVWSTLFHDYIRVGNLPRKYFVQKMVWVQLSYLSPLIAHRQSSMPATEAFRRFFLRRYNITSIDRPLNCSRVNVLFIWRRDYLAHPRNPSGHVVRKIKNEDDLVAEVRHEIPESRVRGVQIDLLPMSQQLQMVSETDILVGMHGAGLTHALFLPPHGGLVEMYPTYWSEGNVHFKKIAEWRSLHYQRWVNHNPRLEYANHYTRIPPGVVSSMIRQVFHGMQCSEKHRH